MHVIFLGIPFIVPDWAKYIAADNSGAVYVYDHPPVVGVTAYEAKADTKRRTYKNTFMGTIAASHTLRPMVEITQSAQERYRIQGEILDIIVAECRSRCDTAHATIRFFEKNYPQYDINTVGKLSEILNFAALREQN